MIPSIESLAPGVLVFRSLFSDLEARRIGSSIIRQNEWVPAKEGTYLDNKVVEFRVDQSIRSHDVCLPPNDIETLVAVRQQVLRKSLLDRTGIKISRFSQRNVLRFDCGSHVDTHADTGPFETSRVFTCIYYVNDNFEGGLLTFPDLCVTYTPVTGEVICFLSEFRHTVSVVTKGVRYCIIWFGETGTPLHF